jgi:redox-sensitive bicupin YhaK (pirin superfamily)
LSGPLDLDDGPTPSGAGPGGAHPVVVLESRRAEVGAATVRRALPNRGRRAVGAWCFADHFGPLDATEGSGIDVGPHPHMGLQTVTWLLEGEVLHRDSLGSEQVIRPGQLNLMTAGHGVAHSEETTGSYRGPLHGIQLWVAQPSTTRDGPPAFEHHAVLPEVELGGGNATVLVGELDGVASPARRDTDHLGVDLRLFGGRTTVPLRPGFEHALIVTDAAVSVDGRTITPGQLADLGAGRGEIVVTTRGPARALLLGGTPFPERLLMWWNFVARTRDEVESGYRDWAAGGSRFGSVASPLSRIEVEHPTWR